MLHNFTDKNFERTPNVPHRLTEIDVPTLHQSFGKTFYKLSDASDGRMGVQYKDGLNVDPRPFLPQGNAQGGGLYFFSDTQLIFLKYNWFIPFKVKYIRKVSFEGEAADARIWVEDRKFKANKCIYGPRSEYSGNATDYVDWSDYDACMRAVLEDTYPCVLRFVQESMRTRELCDLTMVKHPRSFKYLPAIHQTYDNIKKAIMDDPRNIRFCKVIPPDDLLELALKKGGTKIARYLTGTT